MNQAVFWNFTGTGFAERRHRSDPKETFTFLSVPYISRQPIGHLPTFGHGIVHVGEHIWGDTMRHSQWLNLVGFPGVAVPVGMSRDGLPIGVQVIGRPYEEELVLAVAEAIERGRGSWQAPIV